MIIHKLVFPSSTKNHVHALNIFKQASKNKKIKPPKFYNTECIILYIMHTRLRHRSSNLNADLFYVKLVNDPGCLFMHSDVPRKFHDKNIA